MFNFLDANSPATVEMIKYAEAKLGVVLPESYKRILLSQNGGNFEQMIFPTNFPTSWDVDGFAVNFLYGVGEDGIDGELGSQYLVQEWDYPDVGVVVFGTPSAGHDIVILDYTNMVIPNEPSVLYYDEGVQPQIVAKSFENFISQLRNDSSE